MNELRKRHLALPEDVWRQVKSRAAIEGLTIADYITKLVRTEIITPVYRQPWDAPVHTPSTEPSIRKDKNYERLFGDEPTPDIAIGGFGHSSPAPKTRKSK